MSDRYSEHKDDPLRQAINSDNQKRQREEYRRQVAENPDRNTGLPGYHKTESQTEKKSRSHKSSQDPDMLEKDDRYLDDDNNMRKDADVNRDQK